MTNAALCRVCLTSDAKMHHIANTRYQGIFEKLSTKLYTADQRPETVCYVCFSQLQRCRRFVDMSRRAEEILTQLSLDGIQATEETVTELNLSMKLSLSVAPMQYLFTGINQESSQMPATEEAIDIKEEGTEEEEIRVATVYSHNSCQVTDSEEATSMNTDELAEGPLETVSDNYVSSEIPIKISEFLKVQVHTEENQYDCNICNKKFNRKSLLTTHKRVHSGEKPYVCNICNQTFNQNPNLVRHMRVHTGEKPYDCNVCNKKFISKSILITHMRVHSGEKPYTCNICDLKFNQSSNLIRHMKLHTGDKPYACEICHRKFNRKHLLTAHNETAH